MNHILRSTTAVVAALLVNGACGPPEPKVPEASEDEPCAMSLDALTTLGGETSDLNATATFEGKTFTAGDRVVISQRAPDITSKFTNLEDDVRATAGHTGTFLGEVKEPDPGFARVRWNKQDWRNDGGAMVELGCFESQIHLQYIEVEQVKKPAASAGGSGPCTGELEACRQECAAGDKSLCTAMASRLEKTLQARPPAGYESTSYCGAALPKAVAEECGCSQFVSKLEQYARERRMPAKELEATMICLFSSGGKVSATAVFRNKTHGDIYDAAIECMNRNVKEPALRDETLLYLRPGMDGVLEGEWPKWRECTRKPHVSDAWDAAP